MKAEGGKMSKRKLMLISPMLHQGGFERVCVTTARLLQPYFDVTIVIFDSANIAYDVEGLSIIDIQMGVRKGKLQKILNIIRRSRKVRKLKKEMQPEIAYSFGPTANMVNAFSRTGKEKVWLGLRNYTDVEEETKMRLLVKKADLIVCCSRDIEKSIKIKYKFNNTADPEGGSRIRSAASFCRRIERSRKPTAGTWAAPLSGIHGKRRSHEGLLAYDQGL